MTSNGIYKFLLSFHIIPSTTFPRQLKIILASLSVWNPPWPPLLKSVFFKTGKHPHSPIQIEVIKTKFFYLFLKVSRKTLPPISFQQDFVNIIGENFSTKISTQHLQRILHMQFFWRSFFHFVRHCNSSSCLRCIQNPVKHLRWSALENSWWLLAVKYFVKHSIWDVW